MKKVSVIFAVVVFSYIAYLAINFFVHNKRIMDLCDASVAMNYSAVELKAKELDLIFSGSEGKFIIHSTKNLGRGVCLLTVDAEGIVQSAIFDMD